MFIRAPTQPNTTNACVQTSYYAQGMDTALENKLMSRAPGKTNNQPCGTIASRAQCITNPAPTTLQPDQMPQR